LWRRHPGLEKESRGAERIEAAPAVFGLGSLHLSPSAKVCSERVGTRQPTIFREKKSVKMTIVDEAMESPMDLVGRDFTAVRPTQ
jgi:hypothetical protein